MRIRVDIALRNRHCKCSKTIPKGTYHLRGNGYHEQENICPDCALEMIATIIEKNNGSGK